MEIPGIQRCQLHETSTKKTLLATESQPTREAMWATISGMGLSKPFGAHNVSPCASDLNVELHNLISAQLDFGLAFVPFLLSISLLYPFGNGDVYSVPLCINMCNF